jgi:hypothetical protein
VGDQTNEYDFHGDNSYDFEMDYSSSFIKTLHFSGKLKMKVSYGGEWAFQGDSLVMTPDYNSVDIKMDPSGMVPEENMQDSLDVWVNKTRESTVADFKEMAENGERRIIKARLDYSKDKMEWSESDGRVRYLNRKKE